MLKFRVRVLRKTVAAAVTAALNDSLLFPIRVPRSAAPDCRTFRPDLATNALFGRNFRFHLSLVDRARLHFFLYLGAAYRWKTKFDAYIVRSNVLRPAEDLVAVARLLSNCSTSS